MITAEHKSLAIEFPACGFTPTEAKRIREAEERMTYLDGKMEDLRSMKASKLEMQDRFVAGEVDPLTAGVILSALTSPTDRSKMIQPLRSGVKRHIKECVATVADLIEKRYQHRVDHITNLCKSVEAEERARFDSVGAHQDEFEPSEFLHRLRRVHRDTVNHRPLGTRTDLNELLAELAD